MTKLEPKDYPKRLTAKDGSYAELIPSSKNYMLTQPYSEMMVSNVPFPAMPQSGEIHFHSIDNYKIVWNKDGMNVFKEVE